MVEWEWPGDAFNKGVIMTNPLDWESKDMHQHWYLV